MHLLIVARQTARQHTAGSSRRWCERYPTPQRLRFSRRKTMKTFRKNVSYLTDS